MAKETYDLGGLEVFLVTQESTGQEHWLHLCRTFLRTDGSCRVPLGRLGVSATLVLKPPTPEDSD